MPRTSHVIDPKGLEAAAQALGEQLTNEARAQHAYLHRFADGKVSMELEWVDPASLARAAVIAYLAAVHYKQIRRQAPA